MVEKIEFPEFSPEWQSYEMPDGKISYYTGVGQVGVYADGEKPPNFDHPTSSDVGSFDMGQGTFSIPFPKFDDTDTVWRPDTDSDDAEVMLTILSGSVPQSCSPVLHDRLFAKQWCPGINLEHEQARGLVAAFPMWE